MCQGDPAVAFLLSNAGMLLRRRKSARYSALERRPESPAVAAAFYNRSPSYPKRPVQGPWPCSAL